MTQFSSLYAGYYNLIYRDKNYARETDFVLSRAAAHQKTSNPLSIMDLGSGTGRHAFLFQKKGHRIHGVDLSENMVEVARSAAKKSGLTEKEARFDAGDIRELDLGSKFDLAVSLFHVMSYQTTDADVRNTLLGVKRHLKPNSLFIFDFWYGPTVLNLKPQKKTLELSDDMFAILRKTEPTHFEKEHVVNVNFELDVLDKKTNEKAHFTENHRMRYFFIPELEKLLNETGFSLVESGEWLTGAALGLETWNGYVVAKAN